MEVLTLKMSGAINRNSVLAVILFMVYLCQNILRNIFVNMLAVNEVVATLITVIAFGALALFLVKKDNYFKVRCKNKTCVIYIIMVTLILGIINLFPFNVSIEITTISVIIQCFFVSLMEELIFRGYVYKICEEKWGDKKAIILSSILFGVIHMINVLNDDIIMVVLQMAYTTSIGIVFAIIIYKKQGIILSILAHAIINITANLGATETIYKEIIFAIMCVIFAIIMIFRFDLLKNKLQGTIK